MSHALTQAQKKKQKVKKAREVSCSLFQDAIALLFSQVGVTYLTHDI